MATVWAWLKMVPQIWNAILAFIGVIEKAEHDHEDKKIADAAGQAGDPSSTDEKREDATHDLEDIANRHT